ncbi:MAG: Crp/Fnr family transcriptional regulator [Rhodoferax sp.]
MLRHGRGRAHRFLQPDGKSSVLVVPQTPLRAWLDEHPALWRDIGRLACGKLRAAFTALEDMAHLPLEPRLLKHLQLLAQGYGMRAGPARQRIRLPQEQLALMLGVSRQSVNKALQALEAKGAIALRYGQIELLTSSGPWRGKAGNA